MWKVSALSWLGSFCSSYALLFFSSLEHFFFSFSFAAVALNLSQPAQSPFSLPLYRGLRGWRGREAFQPGMERDMSAMGVIFYPGVPMVP